MYLCVNNLWSFLRDDKRLNQKGRFFLILQGSVAMLGTLSSKAKKSIIINVNVQVSSYSPGHKFLPGYYLCSTSLATWVMLMSQPFVNISVRHLYRQYIDTLLGSAGTWPEAWHSTQWQSIHKSDAGLKLDLAFVQTHM